MLNACERLNCPLVKKKQGWLLSSIPQKFEFILGSESRLITFDSPAPEGVEYIGRNHLIVEGLARYLLEQALTNAESLVASRCGFTVTNAVDKPTTILLLRLRHLLSSPRNQELLAEECLIRAFTGSPNNPQWLSEDEAISLWQRVEPKDDYPLPRMQATMERVVSSLPDLEGQLEESAFSRAEVLQESYAISHRAESGEDKPPVHIIGSRLKLEQRAGTPRLSAHALMQEYLNCTEHLWGVIISFPFKFATDD